MRYLYGPVQSRRLGLSLGITLTPHKVCSFDCIYCQLGKTTSKTQRRKSYLDIHNIILELKEFLQTSEFAARPPDYISLSGFGEPTLNIDIAQLIRQIKREVRLIPVALITNASLFSNPKARKDVLGLDLIIPSLDAVTQDVFKKIDRPVPGTKIKAIINGLIALRRAFRGRLFLEIMLVKGLNDSIAYAHKFKKAIGKINPDKIQLNTPVRSTAEKWVKVPGEERLFQIKEVLGKKCEII